MTNLIHLTRLDGTHLYLDIDEIGIMEGINREKYFKETGKPLNPDDQPTIIFLKNAPLSITVKHSLEEIGESIAEIKRGQWKKQAQIFWKEGKIDGNSER